MLTVRAWSLYDLGNAYGFAIKDEEVIYYSTTNHKEIGVDATTYIRLIFTFDMTEENLFCMSKNGIEWKQMNPTAGYFTSDMTFFPLRSIGKLKECISEEMLALINTHSDIQVLKEYLSWFIRNIDTTNAVYVDIPLDRELLEMENVAKNYAPLHEIYSRLEMENPFKKKIEQMYPAAIQEYYRNKEAVDF